MIHIKESLNYDKRYGCHHCTELVLKGYSFLKHVDGCASSNPLLVNEPSDSFDAFVPGASRSIYLIGSSNTGTPKLPRGHQGPTKYT
jgi:hypothetical protein